MGCDIHIYIEKKVKGKWLAVDKWEKEDDRLIVQKEFYEGRSYSLFGILAGVRRDDIPRISEPKGIPKDCCKEISACYLEWNGDAHSSTWLTLSEIMQFDWSQEVKSTGIVDFATYVEWSQWGKRQGESPSSYCKAVGGGGFILSTEESFDRVLRLAEKSSNFHEFIKAEKKQRTHEYTHVSWSQPLYKLSGGFLNETLPRLWPIQREKGVEDVRLVFWFDN